LTETNNTGAIRIYCKADVVFSHEFLFKFYI